MSTNLSSYILDNSGSLADTQQAVAVHEVKLTKPLLTENCIINREKMVDSLRSNIDEYSVAKYSSLKKSPTWHGFPS